MGKFPDEIFDDVSAKELELFDFGTKIPDRIKTLTKVTQIRMGNSRCPALPDALFGLPKLKALAIGLEWLKAVPSSISKAKALRELMLDGCYKLKELPDAIGKTKLTELRMIPGNLKKVPAALWNVSTLKWLALPSTVTTLPPGISKLGKLEILEIGGDALLSIASELPKLKRLKKLSIELEDGVVLPAELTQLKLKELGVGSRVFTELPELFTKIQTVEELDVYGMYQLTKLADAVEKFPNLRFVNFQKKKFSAGERKRIEAHVKRGTTEE
ncbi:MAG: hypothetical protein QM831_44870 [Kofleriaceae bacterium]